MFCPARVHVFFIRCSFDMWALVVLEWGLLQVRRGDRNFMRAHARQGAYTDAVCAS
jgi:hypothetical protein